MGYAALTVPATSVSREKDVPDQEWLDHVPRNAGDKFNQEQCKCSCADFLSDVLILW